MLRASLFSRAALKFLAVAAVLGIARIATAAGPGIDTNDPNLPPAGIYLSPDDVHAMYSGPGLAIVLKAVQHKPFAHGGGTAGIPDPVVTTSGANEMESFQSELDGVVSVNAGPDQALQMTGPVSVESFGKAGQVTGTFSTEMLSMSLSGGGGLMIRESPTLTSTGQTSITAIGGGLYHIDSFFDVFTELSLDGGQSWIPSSTSTHVDLAPLPEPGSLTLLGVAGLGLMARRRRPTA